MHSFEVEIVIKQGGQTREEIGVSLSAGVDFRITEPFRYHMRPSQVLGAGCVIFTPKDFAAPKAQKKSV